MGPRVLQTRVWIQAPPLSVVCSKSSNVPSPSFSFLICRRWRIISTYLVCWLKIQSTHCSSWNTSVFSKGQLIGSSRYTTQSASISTNLPLMTPAPFACPGCPVFSTLTRTSCHLLTWNLLLRHLVTSSHWRGQAATHLAFRIREFQAAL